MREIYEDELLTCETHKDEFVMDGACPECFHMVFENWIYCPNCKTEIDCKLCMREGGYE